MSPLSVRQPPYNDGGVVAPHPAPRYNYETEICDITQTAPVGCGEVVVGRITRTIPLILFFVLFGVVFAPQQVAHAATLTVNVSGVVMMSLYW